MNAKERVFIGVVVVCLGVISPSLGDDLFFRGAHIKSLPLPTTEPTVVEEFEVTQDAFLYSATDLRFRVWQKEDNIDIIAWDIDVGEFSTGEAYRTQQPEPAHSQAVPSGQDPDNGKHAIFVTAKFFGLSHQDPDDYLRCTPGVYKGTVVRIIIRLWLTSYNTIRIADATWSTCFPPGASAPANIPDHGWSIGYPVPIATLPGQFAHPMSFSNDSNDPIYLSDASYMAMPEAYHDFNNVSFKAATPAGEMQLAGGKATKGVNVLAVDIATKGELLGSFIYHTYKIGKFAGDPNAIVVKARHLVVPPPTDGPTLSQWGLIVMGLLIAGVGAAAIVRRRRLSAT